MPSKEFERARHLAERFTKFAKFDAAAGIGNLSDEVYVYWFNDTKKIYEFTIDYPITNNRGFVLISGTTQLPPILDFSLKGGSLQQWLNREVSFYFQDFKRQANSTRWLYVNSFEYICEIHLADNTYIYVKLPIGAVWHSEAKISVLFEPACSRDWSRSRWEAWDGSEKQLKGALTPYNTMAGWTVPSYNQTCRGRKAKRRSGSGSYCSPKCIAGCVPVAWVALAGAFASHLDDDQIFSDAGNWLTPLAHLLQWTAAFASQSDHRTPHMGDSRFHQHNMRR
jgi:hypothetical protein